MSTEGDTTFGNDKGNVLMISSEIVRVQFMLCLSPTMSLLNPMTCSHLLFFTYTEHHSLILHLLIEIDKYVA